LDLINLLFELSLIKQDLIWAIFFCWTFKNFVIFSKFSSFFFLIFTFLRKSSELWFSNKLKILIFSKCFFQNSWFFNEIFKTFFVFWHFQEVWKFLKMSKSWKFPKQILRKQIFGKKIHNFKIFNFFDIFKHSGFPGFS